MAAKKKPARKRTRAVKPIKSAKTAMQMVKLLREFWENEKIYSDEKRNLWEIITGLRGPDFDDPDDKIKMATTAVIRYHTLGMAPSNSNGAIINPDEPAYVTMRKSMPVGPHFQSHARRAFSALDLSWGELNS